MNIQGSYASMCRCFRDMPLDIGLDLLTPNSSTRSAISSRGQWLILNSGPTLESPSQRLKFHIKIQSTAGATAQTDTLRRTATGAASKSSEIKLFAFREPEKICCSWRRLKIIIQVIVAVIYSLTTVFKSEITLHLNFRSESYKLRTQRSSFTGNSSPVGLDLKDHAHLP